MHGATIKMTLKNSFPSICLWSMRDRANDVLRVASSCWIWYIPYIISFNLCRIHTCQRTLIEYAEYRRSLTCYWYATKVKCSLVQALRLCTGRTAHRGSRGMLCSFLNTTLEGVRGQRHAPAALYPRERPDTRCTGGWVGPRAGLDRCGKSRPHRN